MTTITPFLWFDDQLEEAIEFYSSVFPDAKVHGMNRSPDGKEFTGEVTLEFTSLGPLREKEMSSTVACCPGTVMPSIPSFSR